MEFHPDNTNLSEGRPRDFPFRTLRLSLGLHHLVRAQSLHGPDETPKDVWWKSEGCPVGPSREQLGIRGGRAWSEYLWCNAIILHKCVAYSVFTLKLQKLHLEGVIKEKKNELYFLRLFVTNGYSLGHYFNLLFSFSLPPRRPLGDAC